MSAAIHEFVISKLLDGKYRLGDVLGHGGMGLIHVAEDVATGRTVAVKLLQPWHADDPAMVSRLVEEARNTGRVSHPNVIRLLDHGRAVGFGPYLVMERIHGAPLGIMIRDQGPLVASRIVRVAAQLLAGLDAIHRAGLAHGDVKSDNMLVDPHANDRVTIIDFGVACPLGSGGLAERERVLAGTPEYMAPEVIRGERASIASDLYGVGVILYEMVTATTPFGGGTADDIFERHLTEAVVPPSTRCTDCSIPSAFERLICSALEKKPKARPASAAELAFALREALPASCERETKPTRPSARFSTNGDTADWLRPSLVPTAT